MEDVVLMEKRGDICTISLNRPERNHGVNLELLTHLADAINSVNKDKEIRVVILRGSGDKVFSTGGDLGDEVRKGRRPEEVKDLIPYFRDAIENTSQLIDSCRCPVIAMIYGDCLNAGCHMAVSCDFRIASDISRFQMYTVLVGTVFQYQAIQRFVNVIGINNAKELLYTARIIDAQKAKEWGLINYVVPSKDVLSTTMSLAREIAEKAPLAVSNTKATFSRIFKYQQTPSSKDKVYFQELLDITVNSEDAKEGNKAFIEGRKPHFIGK